jgi:hypothetical protein
LAGAVLYTPSHPTAPAIPFGAILTKEAMGGMGDWIDTISILAVAAGLLVVAYLLAGLAGLLS